MTSNNISHNTNSSSLTIVTAPSGKQIKGLYVRPDVASNYHLKIPSSALAAISKELSLFSSLQSVTD